jgi:hypothetical protein
MKATQKLHELGQSIWLDNITRDLLTGGTLKRYISELALTGLTSNPTIFDQAIKNSSAYDSAIRAKLKEGRKTVLRVGDRRPFTGRRYVSTGVGSDQRGRWVGIARGFPTAGLRRCEHQHCSQGVACEGATLKSIH